MFQVIGERMTKELTLLTPSTRKVKVIAAPGADVDLEDGFDESGPSVFQWNLSLFLPTDVTD